MNDGVIVLVIVLVRQARFIQKRDLGRKFALPA